MSSAISSNTSNISLFKVAQRSESIESLTENLMSSIKSIKNTPTFSLLRPIVFLQKKSIMREINNINKDMNTGKLSTKLFDRIDKISKQIGAIQSNIKYNYSTQQKFNALSNNLISFTRQPEYIIPTHIHFFQGENKFVDLSREANKAISVNTAHQSVTPENLPEEQTSLYNNEKIGTAVNNIMNAIHTFMENSPLQKGEKYIALKNSAEAFIQSALTEQPLDVVLPALEKLNMQSQDLFLMPSSAENTIEHLTPKTVIKQSMEDLFSYFEPMQDHSSLAEISQHKTEETTKARTLKLNDDAFY